MKNIANLIVAVSAIHPTVLHAGCTCEIPTNFDWTDTQATVEKIIRDFGIVVDFPFGDREKSSSGVGCHSNIADEIIIAYWRAHQVPVPSVYFYEGEVRVLSMHDRINLPDMALTSESHTELLDEVQKLLPHLTVQGQRQ